MAKRSDRAAGRKCSIPGCGRYHEARGWCAMHWTRWKRYGDPLADVPGAIKYVTPEESLAHRVKQVGECTIWQGTLGARGHGMIRAGGRMVPAHRFVWERSYGPAPEGMQIDHICHNPACVNLSHLRLATPQENSRNRRSATSLNRSGFRGVSRNGRGWSASAAVDGRKIHGGTFDTPEEAASKAEEMRQELFGAFAGGGGVGPRITESKES